MSAVGWFAAIPLVLLGGLVVRGIWEGMGRAGIRKPTAFERALAEARKAPDSGSPLTRPELIEALRALASRDPKTRDELTRLEADSLILAKRIERSPELHDVPHELWHFLHDADIRFKSSDWRDQQLEAMKRWIREI